MLSYRNPHLSKTQSVTFALSDVLEIPGTEQYGQWRVEPVNYGIEDVARYEAKVLVEEREKGRSDGGIAGQFSILAFLTFSDGQKVTFLPLWSRKMVNGGICLLKGARKVIILASGKPSQLACSHRAEMHDL